MKVKVFVLDAVELEMELTAWIGQMKGLKIHHIAQSESTFPRESTFVTFTVLYEGETKLAEIEALCDEAVVEPEGRRGQSVVADLQDT